MAASYPSSVKSFTALNPGDIIQDTDPEVAYDEVTAIEQALLTAGFAHNLFPSTNTARDLGTAALNWRDLFIGRGVKFPATQNPSTDVNLLDDYEEGTWTPTIIGTGGQSGQVYTTQQGQYIKIGKYVFISGRIVLSTLGTVTTAVAIGGLPFTSDNVTYSTAAAIYFFNFTNTKVGIVGLIPATQTRIELFALAAAATGYTALVQADMSNTTDLIFSACYRASA